MLTPSKPLGSPKAQDLVGVAASFMGCVGQPAGGHVGHISSVSAHIGQDSPTTTFSRRQCLHTDHHKQSRAVTAVTLCNKGST